MDTESSEPRADGAKLERAIVLQVLSEERRWSRTELAAELGADATGLDSALAALDGQGVLCLAENDVWASPAARRLDELELIGI
jgi:DNA-binding GntR family transcriptional regulator